MTIHNPSLPLSPESKLSPFYKEINSKETKETLGIIVTVGKTVISDVLSVAVSVKAFL